MTQLSKLESEAQIPLTRDLDTQFPAVLLKIKIFFWKLVGSFYIYIKAFVCPAPLTFCR